MLSSSARNRKYIGLHHESVDSKIRFTIEPLPGDDAFDQWKDAMKAVVGLSMGIPIDYRKKVWLALADNYLNGLCIDWEKTKSLAFNRKSNPDDNKLDQQIVKDLHRTGCSGFSGHDNDDDRAMLQRVLLAYARWNKQVGYCQGFNVIAALILDVMDRQEDCALKVMIYLIDRVLPESYFANNLRALSVDMAVFRHLLRLQLPKFSRHLERLQRSANDQSTGRANYEPPLTDVFTMQWFLTLFATCLPKSTALRIWDAVLLEGSEVLLRAAVGIWGTLQSRLITIQSADEFYTTMGTLSQEMLDGTIIDEDLLIQTVYDMKSCPAAIGLSELRQAYANQLLAAVAAAAAGRASGADLQNGADLTSQLADVEIDVNCFSGMLPFPQQLSPQRSPSGLNLSRSESNTSLSDSFDASLNGGKISSLDVDMLNKQYARLQERQKQACVILNGTRQSRSGDNSSKQAAVSTGARLEATVAPSVAVNHLYVGREMTQGRRSRPNSRSPVMVVSEPVEKPKSDTGTELVHQKAAPRPTANNNNATASVDRSSSVAEDAMCSTNERRNSSEKTPDEASSLPMATGHDVSDVKRETQPLTSSPIGAPSDGSPSQPPTDKEANNADQTRPTGATTDSHQTTAEPADESIQHNRPIVERRQTTAASFAKNINSQSDKTHNGTRSSNDLSTAADGVTNVVSVGSKSCTSPPQPNCGTFSSSSSVKAFSPFPKQVDISRRRRTPNSIRLGLYAAAADDGAR